MRDIKYRLWCKDLEEIIEVNKMGFENNELWYIECIDHDKELLYFPEKNDHVLMQYTGIKDKNGKDIYEGDVVKGYWWQKGESHRHIGKITYGMAAFKVVGVKKYLGMTDELSPVYEVIGNIYENPELLEVAE